ncbi:tol-pal system YbgF family protein [Prevotella sp. HJM029]|jgi:tetratricopeptide repeat protein|uniref:tetratricopeptide repeat protein n=1 Tax=Prevotella sp. HJM029 TaxID=1433844 RepID=UPI00048CF5FA|nr:tetratricopeptide repeat protein [Prevotella sp. HJM029]MBF1587795.1 tetratricopeptide repeat protein [Prevotella sp.]
MTNIKEQEALHNGALVKPEAFAMKYRKAIIIAVAAIIIAVVGGFLYQAYVAQPREDKASTALAKGQEYFDAEQFDKALKGDGTGYMGLLNIINDYSSTDAANLANLYAGLCYANLNKWNDAVKYLDAYSPADDAMVSPAAIAALGNAYAHINQLDKAIDNLEKAAEMADKQAKDGANNSIAPTFYLQAGILLESQGKKDKALELYKKIKANYVNAQLVQSQEIDKYIERASR